MEFFLRPSLKDTMRWFIQSDEITPAQDCYQFLDVKVFFCKKIILKKKNKRKKRKEKENKIK